MDQNKHIEHFQIKKILSKNKFGITYKCFDTQNNRIVVLKELKTAPTKESLEVLKKINSIESDLLLKSEYFTIDNQHYIIRDYIEGTDLKTILNSTIKYSHLTQSFIVKMYIQILKQLQLLHQAGILHTDVKPSNILIQHKLKEKIKNWNPETIKILDYERAISFPVSPLYKYKGFSMIYSPPEQILKRADLFNESMDVFAATITLLESLSKQRPLYDCNAEVMINLQLTYPIPKPRKVSQEIFDIISPAIYKQRFSKPPRLLNYEEITQTLSQGIEQRPRSSQEITDKLNLWLKEQNIQDSHWLLKFFKRIFIDKQ